MALQKDFVTESGFELKNAYYRVDTFHGDRNQVRLGIGVYVNEQMRREGKPAAGYLEYIIPTPNTSGNMFAEMYAYLKTLPEFDDAIDV